MDGSCRQQHLREEALAELRINAAQDLGDDRGETSVGFLASPATRSKCVE
ncbi:hypothetical protein [Akkermansia sp.]